MPATITSTATMATTICAAARATTRIWFDWSGTDFLQGGKGNDFLYGDAVDYQRDVLHGGLGVDFIFGGTGYDLMIGGQGDDLSQPWVANITAIQGPGVRGPPAARTASQPISPPIMVRLGCSPAAAWRQVHVDFNPEGVATAVTMTDYRERRR